MVKKIGIRKMAELVLEDTKGLLSPMEIWLAAKKSNRKEVQDQAKMVRSRTPDYSIAAEIYTDLKKENSVFYQPSSGMTGLTIGMTRGYYPKITKGGTYYFPGAIKGGKPIKFIDRFKIPYKTFEFGKVTIGTPNIKRSAADFVRPQKPKLTPVAVA